MEEKDSKQQIPKYKLDLLGFWRVFIEKLLELQKFSNE